MFSMAPGKLEWHVAGRLGLVGLDDLLNHVLVAAIDDLDAPRPGDNIDGDLALPPKASPGSVLVSGCTWAN